jgi:hypothetical protein
LFIGAHFSRGNVLALSGLVVAPTRFRPLLARAHTSSASTVQLAESLRQFPLLRAVDRFAAKVFASQFVARRGTSVIFHVTIH